MTARHGFRLEIADLREVIQVLGEALPTPEEPELVLSAIGLSGRARTPIQATAHTRWQAVVQAALDNDADYVDQLINEAGQRAGKNGQQRLQKALSNVGAACLQRVLRAEHPEVADHVDGLISASTVQEMRATAGQLRWTALELRRMLTTPLLSVHVAALAKGVVDPEQQRLELADLAVDVVTATDYLLDLLGLGTGPSRPFRLEDDTAGTASREDPDLLDRRRRRQLDARATAVRLGGRLLAAFRGSQA